MTSRRNGEYFKNFYSNKENLEETDELLHADELKLSQADIKKIKQVCNEQ
jgi:phosphotransferase system IIA component